MAEAEAFNAKADGWAFVIPDYKVRIIDRKFLDLITEDTPEEPAAAEQTGE